MSDSFGLSLMILMIAIILVLLVSNIRESMDSRDTGYDDLLRRHQSSDKSYGDYMRRQQSSERRMQWKQGTQKLQELQRTLSANGKDTDVSVKIIPFITMAVMAVVILLVGIIFESASTMRDSRQTVERYYDNGVLKSHVEYYRNGNTALEQQYHDNGGLKYECNFNKDGMVQNESRYYKNGALKSEKTYDEGILWFVTEYDKNGEVTMQEDYEEGILYHSYEFEDGKLTRHKEFWKNGNVRIEEEYDENEEVISYIYYQLDGSISYSASHDVITNYDEYNNIIEITDSQELENGLGTRTFSYNGDGQISSYELNLTVPGRDDHDYDVFLLMNPDNYPMSLYVYSDDGSDVGIDWSDDYDDSGNYIGPDFDYVITDVPSELFDSLEFTRDESGFVDGVIVH